MRFIIHSWFQWINNETSMILVWESIANTVALATKERKKDTKSNQWIEHIHLKWNQSMVNTAVFLLFSLFLVCHSHRETTILIHILLHQQFFPNIKYLSICLRVWFWLIEFQYNFQFQLFFSFWLICIMREKFSYRYNEMHNGTHTNIVKMLIQQKNPFQIAAISNIFHSSVFEAICFHPNILATWFILFSV